MEETFKKEMKVLFNMNSLTSQLVFKIIDIKKDFNEYCLTVEFGNKYEVIGFYIKNDNRIKINSLLLNCQFILKKEDFNIKIYIKEYLIKKENNIINIGSETKIKFNIDSDNVISFLVSLNLLKNDLIEKEVFLITEIKKSIIIKDIITLKEYIIDPSKLENMKDLKLNEFIFIKYFSITNKTIGLNNCSFIQKANDYQIFKILEQKINSEFNLKNKEDFFEIEPIKNKNEIKERYIFSKVVLKDRKKNFILILDKFNRIIKYDLKADDNIDLYDLILITNCYIIKSSEDKYIYELRINEKKENSLFYVSKELFFNKEIQINNYTILDILFPDFKTKNYYNVIKLCDHRIPIKHKRQIYIFKFENEQFNEIVPFEIKFIKRKYTFKFFITHNLINKINILINCSQMNTCAIDYCYYNIYTDEIPYFINLYVNNEKYKIEHYNNFDNFNRIGFIVLNVPATEETKKIKDKEGEKQIKDNKGIISAQIWYTANKKENHNLTYDLIQILDVNEAKKKIYYKYNLKDKNFEIFKDFYFEMINFYENWESEKNSIFKYFQNFSQKVKKIEEELKLLSQYYNTDYDPDSADYYNYKIYVNISLFQALQNLKKLCQNDFEDTLNVWKIYIRQYSNFLKKINNNIYKLTFHQKMRIIDAFCTN